MPRTAAPLPETKVSSKLKRINKMSISEEIAQQIMKLIADGHLAPGQRLPTERDLCTEFGISRTALREALRCLSIVGVLDAKVGGGTHVAKDGAKFLGNVLEWRLITEKHDIGDLLELRIALESVAAGNAAIRASGERIAELKGLLASMKRAMNNTHQFASLDLDFHVAIAGASQNALLLDLIMMIRGQVVRGLSRVLPLPDVIAVSYKEHTAIFRAIEKRSPEDAAKAMETHLGNAVVRYRKAVGEDKSRPQAYHPRDSHSAAFLGSSNREGLIIHPQSESEEMLY